MTRSLTVAALIALAACSPPPTDGNKDGIADGVRVPTDVSLVAPSSPVGAVSGQVVNSKFLPLDGVSVVLVIGGKTDGTGLSYKATTDGEGNFAFKDVPAGANGEVLASKQGFGSVRVGVTVPAAAGNFPLNDGNANVGMLMLMELSTTLRFTVMTASGRPAKGAKALLEVAPIGAQSFTTVGYGLPLGQLSVDTAVDQDGYAAFANVPAPGEMARVNPTAVGYTLVISDLDEDGDGHIDYNGQVNTYTGTALFTRAPAPIVLADARIALPLNIVASNVETLANGSGLPMRNVVRPSEAISVFFNQPVLDQSVIVKVVDDNCSTSIAVTRTMRPDHWGFTITPNANSWQSSKRFNVVVRATGLDAANTISRVGYFFAADPLQPVQLSTTARFEFRKLGGNTNLAKVEYGDAVFAIFDLPIMQMPGSAGAAGFVSLDMNGNNSTGTGPTDRGESGAPFDMGYAMVAAEPTSDPTGNGTFACRTSGYATRYQMLYQSLPPAGFPQFIPNTQMRVMLPKDSSSTDGFQTIWGQPATAPGDTFNGALILGQ